ncbi:diacylglycerol/lipid kinase family protein [Actinomyces faecalis]|uniref:diacylglycerol/lipid kinase family protein n=1 Tax=Actinomyces faecalis TaxID=2722820 RepID=UPI001556E3FD|nr:diacylglycerol kinase family protein [Actinomyces faecalis]
MSTKQTPRGSLARRLWTSPEITLTLGSAVLFAVWTWLTLAGHLGWLDRLLRPPFLPPRSLAGQVSEAFSLLTHPFFSVIMITGVAVFSYKARMRRLALAMAVAAAGLPAQVVLAFVIDRPRPLTAFSDSISHFGGAYPASHVTTMTILAWVLVTLTRAHRRSTSIVARWAAVGVAVVALTAVSQWTMALIHVSDAVGGVLLGVAVANLALTVGGLSTILSGWAHLGLPKGSVDKRAAVILNPTKFDDLSLLRRRVEAEVLAAGWHPTTWLETTAEDPGHEAAHRALEAGVDLVMVAGGDGTVRAVSSELAGTGTPMALLPSGTGNLLARNLGVPLDTDAALRLALNGRTEAIDVVHAVSDAGEERFVVMAGMGLDAQIMEDTNDDLKKVIRSGAYAVAAVQNAVPDPFTITVTIDDAEPVEHQAVMALLGNVGTITGGMTLFPDASPTDSQVDLLIASPDKVTDWAKLGAQVLTGRDMSGFPVTSGHRVLIEAEREIPFELDGDTAGSTRRLEVQVEEGALHVVVP